MGATGLVKLPLCSSALLRWDLSFEPRSAAEEAWLELACSQYGQAASAAGLSSTPPFGIAVRVWKIGQASFPCTLQPQLGQPLFSSGSHGGGATGPSPPEAKSPVYFLQHPPHADTRLLGSVLAEIAVAA